MLPSLRSSGELNTRRGERAFSVLLFQDLSIVPMITIIAAMSRAPLDPDQPSGTVLALYTVGAIVGLVLAGRYVGNPLFRLVGRLGERELFVVAGLFAIIASAALMEALHLSVALGAFIAGVVLAEYRRTGTSWKVTSSHSARSCLGCFSVGRNAARIQCDRRAAAVRRRCGGDHRDSSRAALIAGLARLFGVRSGRAIWLGCC